MSHAHRSLPDADEELRLLVARICDGSAMPEDRDRLQARFDADPQAIEYYVVYLDLHAQLQWRYRGNAAQSMAQDDASQRHRPLVNLAHSLLRPTPFSLSVAALVMGLLITTLAFISPPIYRAVSRRGVVRDTEFVAEVSRVHNATWHPPRATAAARQQLAPGDEIELVTGLAEIQFHRGARVTLEGPARFRVVSNNGARLDFGKLVAKVNAAAHGFEVHTPLIAARDLGTEFAVAVENDGATDVHVFQGSVELTRTRESTSAGELTHVLTRGQRIQVPAKGPVVLTDAGETGTSFVRRVPAHANELRISAAYVKSIHDAGPEAYWRCESVVEGRIANEISPHYELEVVGDVRLLPTDDDNSSAVFGGTSRKHYLACGDFDLLADEEYTVELWCQPYTQSPRTMVMLGLARDVVTDSLMLSLEGQGSTSTKARRVRFLHRSPAGTVGGSDLYSADTTVVGQWHHVVAVYDRGNTQLFLNGQLANATAGEPLSSAARTLLLGRLRTDDTDARPLIGRLDEIAIYRRALSADEVRQHFELIKPTR